MPYIDINPIIFQIGPLTATWYGFAYMLGFLLGWYMLKKITAKNSTTITQEHCDDYIIWAMVGVIFGGRLGYLLAYRTEYLTSFFKAIAIWNGGMSFHGGLIGVLIVTIFYAKMHKLRFLHLLDFLACVTPIGIFFGRIANYINGELYGRMTDVAWGTIFPTGGPYPRHPSQLYEALLEGLILFLILNYARIKMGAAKFEGMLSGLFLTFYAGFRIFIENFREPDFNLGLYFNAFTMGQILSFPALAFGLYLIFFYSKKHVIKS